MSLAILVLNKRLNSVGANAVAARAISSDSEKTTQESAHGRILDSLPDEGSM
jgi:hypothetical protein